MATNWAGGWISWGGDGQPDMSHTVIPDIPGTRIAQMLNYKINYKVGDVITYAGKQHVVVEVFRRSIVRLKPV